MLPTSDLYPRTEKINLSDYLHERIGYALDRLGVPDANPSVTRASRPEFGDYQVNAALSLAKRLKRNPRDIANEIVEHAQLDEIADTVDVAGPGFLNITLSDRFLALQIDQSIPLRRAKDPETVVIDYSSPNLAKEMHVGHLRSTVIGDAVARTMEMAGHIVIRQNHVGDWGTPFGKLVAYMDEVGMSEFAPGVASLEQLYVAATERFETDPDFATRARKAVVDLQSGDRATYQKWTQVRELSVSHMQSVYDRLGVSLSRSDIRGESEYNGSLSNVIRQLDSQELLTEDDGALCVFVGDFKNKEGKPLPVLVQKSDGGYLYHTTDLAAVRYRMSNLRADRVLYFTDARQNLHFEMLFAVAYAAKFAYQPATLEHHPFGKMVDTAGRPYRSRDDTSIPLTQLLDEGESRARKIVDTKSSHLEEEERNEVSHAVAISAIKYADLSKDRLQDYVFNWNTMLSFEGNTGPYLLYAYTRIQSIFRRGDIDPNGLGGAVQIEGPEEHALCVQLLLFEETIGQVCRDAKPHYLCSYLYELTARFTRFYENCPVLTAPEHVRASRLKLCARTALTLRLGLECLGIRVVSRM